MTAQSRPPADGKTDVLWFLPTHGDGRYLGTSEGGREVNFNYLRQIAQAADQLGYYGVLLPTGRSCEDSWVVASAVAPWTERLRYLVAVRPGLQSPSVAARMTATLDRLSNGRLLINVVTGGDPIENKGDGIFLDHDERYAVTREFLNVYSDLLAGKTVNVEGKHIQIEDGRLLFNPVQSPRPPLYFGGSSEAGIDVAVDTVDKYLTWGEPPALVADRVHPRENLLRRSHRLVGDVLDQLVGGLPRFRVGLAHDHMQTDAERKFSPARGGDCLHSLHLLGDLRRWLAPGQIFVDGVDRDIDAGIRRSAKIKRRPRRLHRRKQQPAVLDADMLALDIDGIARQQVAIDLEKLARHLVTLVVV